MTLVDHNSQTILIHIPKTGGGSLKKVLSGTRYKWKIKDHDIGSHSTKAEIVTKHPEWAHYTFCAFIRDWDDWKKSIWRAWFNDIPFEEWIQQESVWPSWEWIAKSRQNQRYANRKPAPYLLSEPLQTVKQSEWYDDGTELFDFHNFDEEYKRLCQMMKQTPKSLPQVHATG